MRYRRVEKAEGIHLLKDIVFLEIPLDFLHNRIIEGLKDEFLEVFTLRLCSVRTGLYFFNLFKRISIRSC